MPKKPDKYGIKIWTMVDRNQYTYNMQIYSGKEGIRQEIGVERIRFREVDQGYRVVMDMVSVLNTHNRQHHITTDRFFTSLKAAEELLSKNITLTGTIRENKLEVPDKLRRFTRNGNKKYHNETELKGPKKIPKLNYDYNKNKYFVDNANIKVEF
ncbi:piggyBac transposable element-derived protein 4-like protein [Leptotrombidium deliense]|uniref:PiggyBac transposable element-derived protein 4-like protein n=1 Tax=Leptotrombidium deliense TaxID=299467 RepID=A0A443RSL4_9ACAR|nr:piggyBac transposable element-derived protein 4-like protein [Leptotrombidium deliense]